MTPSKTLFLLASVYDTVSGRSITRLPHHSLFTRDPIAISTEGCPPELPVCFGGGCSGNLLGLDLLNCGGEGIECEASQLCFAGSCQNITLTEPNSPSCPETCSAGQFCGSDGTCQAIQIYFDQLSCGEAEEECEPGSLCVNSRCLPLDLGSDPNSCGPEETQCEPGSWCLGDACQNFQIGTKPARCSTSEDCPLNSSCDSGTCRPLTIGLDSSRCGPDNVQCESGEACLASTCQALNLTQPSPNTCGEDCGPGYYCAEDASCTPITLSLDQDSCGSEDTPCDDGVCFSGVCLRDLTSEEAPAQGFLACGAPPGSGNDGSPGSSNGNDPNGAPSGNQGDSSGGDSLGDGAQGSPEGGSPDGNSPDGGSPVDGSPGGNSGNVNGNPSDDSNGESPNGGSSGDGSSGGSPGDGSSGNGTPDAGPPGDGTPGDGPPGSGTPGSGNPGDGNPGDGSPGDDNPGDGTPGSGNPGSGNPGSGNPGNGTPGDGAPGDGAPGDGNPDDGSQGGDNNGNGDGGGGGNGGGGDNGDGGNGDGGGGGDAPGQCNPACPSNAVCIDQSCRTVTDPSTCSSSPSRLRFLSLRQAVDCGPSAICLDGTCTPITDPGSCGGTACPPGTVCVSDTTCVPTGNPAGCGTDNVVCPDDAPLCVGGQCTPVDSPQDCGGQTCSSTETCINQVCVDNSAPGPCNGQTCDPTESCLAGVCVGPEVGDCGGISCEGLCVNNVCIPDDGTGDCGDSCSPEEICLLGSCVPPLTGNCGSDTCLVDEICLDGQCISSGLICGTVLCPGGQTCTDGVCTDLPLPGDCGNSCTDTEICVLGTCVPDVSGPCGGAECLSSEICVSNICVSRDLLCGNVLCPAGTTCRLEDLVCIPNSVDDCDPDTCEGSCVEGVCVPDGGVPGDCDGITCDGPLEVCLNGQCVLESLICGTIVCEVGQQCVDEDQEICEDIVNGSCDGVECQGPLEVCLNGVCVLESLVCGPVVCLVGQECIDEQQGLCQDISSDACDGVECDGLLEVCLNGQCVLESLVCGTVVCLTGQECVDPDQGLCQDITGDSCDGVECDGLLEVCLNGQCVLESLVCGTVVCLTGQECVDEQQGLCQDITRDACDDVECDGLLEVCLNGQCVLESLVCGTVVCLTGQECVDPDQGLCQDITGDSCDDVECDGLLEVCLNGQCVLESLVCGTVVCLVGQECVDPDQGLCQDITGGACDDVECDGLLEVCLNGQCVLESLVCGSVVCLTGQECVDEQQGLCQDITNDACDGVECDGVLEVCLAGQCVLESLVCGTVVCLVGQECADEEQGLCQDVTNDACDGVECGGALEVCLNGQCVLESLVCGTVVCLVGQECTDEQQGICEDVVGDPCDGVECDGLLEVCLAGQCVLESLVCGTVVCLVGQQCTDQEQGLCEDVTGDPCDGVVCDGLEICVDGECILESDPLDCDGTTCGIGQSCFLGTCVETSRVCGSILCPDGSECADDGITCSGTEDPDPSVCATSDTCPQGEACINLTCQPGCRGSDDCDLGENCNTATGVCSRATCTGLGAGNCVIQADTCLLGLCLCIAGLCVPL